MSRIRFNDNELMTIQASTLFLLNEENRIIGINERNQTSSPAFFIGKTKDSIHPYFHIDLPQRIVDELQHSLEETINLIELCKIIEKYKRVKAMWIGPAYTFSHVLTHPKETKIEVINESNTHLLGSHYSNLIGELEDRKPIVGYIINEEAVSVCCSARRSSKAAEASLMTIEPFRGKGLAQKVVHAWASELTRQGLIPLYSTSWDNLGSQKVAYKLGLHPFGMDFHISTE